MTIVRLPRTAADASWENRPSEIRLPRTAADAAWTAPAPDEALVITIELPIYAPDPTAPIWAATGEAVHPAHWVATEAPIITAPVFESKVALHVIDIHLSLPAPPPVPPWIQADVLPINLDLPDADGTRVFSRHGRRPVTPIGHRSRWASAVYLQLPHFMHTPRPGHQATRQRMIFRDMLPARRPRRLRAMSTLPLRARTDLHHQDSERIRNRAECTHREKTPIFSAARIRQVDTIKRNQSRRLPHQESVCAANRRQVGHQQGWMIQTPLRVLWAQGIPPPPGLDGYFPPSLDFWLTCEPSRPLFCTVQLDTRPVAQPYCPGFDPDPDPEPGTGAIIIPILTRYIVINDFSLIRADTGDAINPVEFSASLDADSWTWGWSARIHGNLLELVRGAPGEYVELIATLNGTLLRLAVERLGRDRRFASSWLRVSGRGRAAALAAPHAPVLTFAATEQRTAQQLLDEALAANNVPIGWSVDWQAVNWSISGGTWSHTGTYMDAAIRLAEAAGAYVQGHDTDKTLHILPRYPSLPWQWTPAGADLVLPEDVCSLEGIEWIDRPAYNAVWISGQEGGRRDRIRRTGSAADRYAPSVVDPLATHVDMTRARGSAILGDTGRQAHISVRLPVLPETGIIKPGKLVQYTEQGKTHLGLSRAVSLEHRFPELWQTIRIETHEGIAP